MLTHIPHDPAAPVVGIRFDELSLVSTDASGRHIEFAKDFSVVYKEVEIYFVQAYFEYETENVCRTPRRLN